jgi:hypothetical protein
MLRNVIPENCTELHVLKCINGNNLSEICPNMILVLKLLPTPPVTVVTAELLFSKLRCKKRTI